jgi:Uma2 family endonuclease
VRYPPVALPLYPGVAIILEQVAMRNRQAAMTQTVVQRHLWSRQEYDRMVSAGVFHPEARLELINGEIVNTTPQGSLHATAALLAEAVLKTAFPAAHIIRVQMPLALDEASEPEPDLAVVPGSPRDYRDAHPTTAMLVVEVADTTLAFDRDTKRRLYARSGIPEYWIVNLIGRQLEVYGEPRGEDCTSQSVLRPGETVAPLAASDHRIAVADLIP